MLGGEEGICAAAQLDTDKVLNSIVGIAGLKPTLAAIDGNDIALANKETLVAGGELVTTRAKEKGVAILPVDSEHSAIFQSLQGSPGKQSVKRLILTASGGPFFGRTRDDLKDVTVEQALKHPNWSMGAKITIDSATMMNKGLELIEAAWLFDMPADKIDILVHRQSVVHSLVEYVDNSVIAQLGVPDMRVPIQYALTYPERYESPAKQLRLEDWKTLTFEQPDYDTFSCINLCRQAITKGGIYPASANGANEAANKLFRDGKISSLISPMQWRECSIQPNFYRATALKTFSSPIPAQEKKCMRCSAADIFTGRKDILYVFKHRAVVFDSLEQGLAVSCGHTFLRHRNNVP